VDIRFETRFKKDLQKITANQSLLQLVQQVIDEIKAAPSIHTLQQMKKMSGFSNFYRIRIRDYRIGLCIQDEQVTFVRCLHRREIYRYFP
jgi:mRNA interferase RelE/StbE